MQKISQQSKLEKKSRFTFMLIIFYTDYIYNTKVLFECNYKFIIFIMEET